MKIQKAEKELALQILQVRRHLFVRVAIAEIAISLSKCKKSDKINHFITALDERHRAPGETADSKSRSRDIQEWAEKENRGDRTVKWTWRANGGRYFRLHQRNIGQPITRIVYFPAKTYLYLLPCRYYLGVTSNVKMQMRKVALTEQYIPERFIYNRYTPLATDSQFDSYSKEFWKSCLYSVNERLNDSCTRKDQKYLVKIYYDQIISQTIYLIDMRSESKFCESINDIHFFMAIESSIKEGDIEIL